MTYDLDESQRQVLLLAIAKLALERPGWDGMLREMATLLRGPAMYDQFKESNSDLSAIRERDIVQFGSPGDDSRAALWLEIPLVVTRAQANLVEAEARFPASVIPGRFEPEVLKKIGRLL